MKRSLLWSIIAVVILAVIAVVAWFRPWAAQSGTAGNKYLTIADVEKATGKTGLKVTESPTGLVFETGFLGDKILEVRFSSPDLYEREVVKNWPVYEPVPGIGDKAAVREPHTAFRLIFVKGVNAVMVQAVPKDGKVPLTRDQLVAIGRMISERM